MTRQMLLRGEDKEMARNGKKGTEEIGVTRTDEELRGTSRRCGLIDHRLN